MVVVRPERFSNLSTTRTNPGAPRRASKVRRGDLVHEAKDQSFRYRKDLGLPNQVCLFRRSIFSDMTAVRQWAGKYPTSWQPLYSEANGSSPRWCLLPAIADIYSSRLGRTSSAR
jgi:hypothetical protein